VYRSGQGYTHEHTHTHTPPFRQVGELSEIFQWRGDAGAGPGLPGFTPKEREHLGEELADVMLYLTRLSDVCGVDLAAAVRDKLKKNAAK
jgi:dCTP diphosphatase